ncbi:SulP family inorganic anion transporter [Laspinema palackyanum]|uniref:SulP family inorganic anion transporter n=1 Tax=Laspinema palackyanum TaxID=3231601 RepID=UPI003F678A2D
MNSRRLRQEWFSNGRADLLAGAVVGLALISEAIAFSIIAGVAPKIGLYASLISAVWIALFMGRIPDCRKQNKRCKGLDLIQ